MEGHIETLTKGQERIEGKMDKFIETADTKYAHKCVEEELTLHKKDTDKRIDKINITLAKYGGGAVVAMFLIQLAFKIWGN